ncbi:hypothetical protein PoB_002043200 [Plakobranchus ocellatus]|uniref:Secreted protein n=1 Tax=Plakobranchus ocellatus TaxID=259542 RepID=A0AAV3ZHE9_9GAST|nr:hypothetical protein PoB_002043200 [Plakobranchus ocellatus]
MSRFLLVLGIRTSKLVCFLVAFIFAISPGRTQSSSNEKLSGPGLGFEHGTYHMSGEPQLLQLCSMKSTSSSKNNRGELQGVATTAKARSRPLCREWFLFQVRSPQDRPSVLRPCCMLDTMVLASGIDLGGTEEM